MNLKFHKKGFTLIEILVTVGIMSMIVGLLGAFQADIFSFNNIIQTGIRNQSEAKKIIRPFSNEVRSASVSNLGSYPVAESASSTFAFYSDIDGDGLKEKIKYFLDGSDFKKSVIKPSGQPLEYDEENEEIIRVIQDVINQDIFEYYDSSYDGTASSTKLVQPVVTSDVRLIKITILIDSDPNRPPGAVEITTQVSIRNLKDNL